MHIPLFPRVGKFLEAKMISRFHSFLAVQMVRFQVCQYIQVKMVTTPLNHTHVSFHYDFVYEHSLSIKFCSHIKSFYSVTTATFLGLHLCHTGFKTRLLYV